MALVFRSQNAFGQKSFVYFLKNEVDAFGDRREAPRAVAMKNASNRLIGPMERYDFNNDRSLDEPFHPIPHPTDEKS
jgi:hypothetical protein